MEWSFLCCFDMVAVGNSCVMNKCYAFGQVFVMIPYASLILTPFICCDDGFCCRVWKSPQLWLVVTLLWSGALHWVSSRWRKSLVLTIRFQVHNCSMRTCGALSVGELWRCQLVLDLWVLVNWWPCLFATRNKTSFHHLIWEVLCHVSHCLVFFDFERNPFYHVLIFDQGGCR